MKNQVVPTIDYAQVRWDSVLVYSKWHGAKGQNKERLEEIQKKAYQGKVTEGARKRMQKACDILIQCSRVKMRFRPGKKLFPFRLAFVTLTVPGQVTDPNNIHPHFKKFTDWLRYRNALYVWKAEYQQRGQIHYHLIINQYIPWQDYRYYWNTQMRKAGQLKEYAQEHGHYNANSVDVRSVHNSKTLVNYLMKYLLKEEKQTDEESKIKMLSKWWGASKSLLDARFEYEIGNAEADQLATSRDVYVDEEKRFAVFRGNAENLLTNYTKKQYNNWKVTRIQNSEENKNTKAPLKAKDIATGEKIRKARQGKLFRMQKTE